MEHGLMSRTLPLDAAKDYLREIVEGMVPGEELVLTAHGEPLATVTRPPRTSWPCQPGSAKDTKHWMAPDFNAPLEDFKEYME
jgi:antitoxin (DNA-binding transcriptional repressor) of toxin-antitoxin stability system